MATLLDTFSIPTFDHSAMEETDSNYDFDEALQNDLYGDNPDYITSTVQDDDPDASGHADEDDQPAGDKNEPAAEAPAAAILEETIITVEDVTGYEERDAAVTDDVHTMEASQLSEAGGGPDPVPAAADFDPSILHLDVPTDPFDIGTPGSIAFEDSSSDISSMQIVLPGHESPFHLCANDAPALLSTRQDLYEKSVSELFKALREDPLLRDRYLDGWIEMTLSVPELQLVLHEDDPYTSEVRLQELTLVHMGFCSPPVKFILGEKFRFQHRFSAYWEEIQRRLESGESMFSTEPFEPVPEPLVSSEGAPFASADETEYITVDDAEHDVEPVQHEDQPKADDQLEESEAKAGPEVNAVEVQYEEYYEDEEGPDGDPPATGVSSQAQPATEDVPDDQPESEQQTEPEGHAENEAPLYEEAYEEESYVHVEAPEEDGVQINLEAHKTAQSGNVDAEYVVEEEHVNAEHYELVVITGTGLADSATEHLEEYEYAFDEPHEVATEEVDGEQHPLDDGAAAGNTVDYDDYESEPENEYNRAADPLPTDEIPFDHFDHGLDDSALEHSAVDAADPHGTALHVDAMDGPSYDADELLEQPRSRDKSPTANLAPGSGSPSSLAALSSSHLDDITPAASGDIAHRAMNGALPTSISGTKRAWEEDADGDGDGAEQGEVSVETHKRLRVE